MGLDEVLADRAGCESAVEQGQPAEDASHGGPSTGEGARASRTRLREIVAATAVAAKRVEVHLRILNALETVEHGCGEEAPGDRRGPRTG